MSKIKHFTDLKAWQINQKVAINIYKLTEKFPPKEKYSLIDQIRRASTSVTANIAEGWGRYHYADRLNFYYHARGSNCEVQSFLLLAKDLEYLSEKDFKLIIDDVYRGYRVLNGLINSVKKLIANN